MVVYSRAGHTAADRIRSHGQDSRGQSRRRAEALCANSMSRKQKAQLSMEAHRKLRTTSPAKRCSLPGHSMTTECEHPLYTQAK